VFRYAHRPVGTDTTGFQSLIALIQKGCSGQLLALAGLVLCVLASAGSVPAVAQTSDSFVSIYRFGLAPPERKWPDFRAIVHVNSKAAYNGLLDKSNFTVFEKGNPIPFSFCPPGGNGGGPNISYPCEVDLKYVFVLDTTISMDDNLQATKQAIADVISRFKDSPETEYVALVSFKDQAKVEIDFTANYGAFLNSLNALTAFGGGDIPEGALNGVETVLNDLDWYKAVCSQPPTVTIRNMLILTDSTTHYRGDGTNVSDVTMPETISTYMWTR